MQPQNPTRLRADLLRRAILGLTDEECASMLPWVRRWMADMDSDERPPTMAAPLRRETDVLGRVIDAVRTPPSLRDGNGQNLFEALESYPGRKADEIRDIIAHVRQTRSHIEREFASEYTPGERRMLRAHPGTRRGWVAISVLAIPAVRSADDDDDLLVAQR
jgi:hypothetical protein